MPRFNPRRPVSRPATLPLAIYRTRRDEFQSTPTGFPAGDEDLGHERSALSGCFNPRRPVSRPATCVATRPARWLCCFNPRRPVSRPATTDAMIASIQGYWFQSTPTGFPAGDDQGRASCHATPSFNPRRPVSRPATVLGALLLAVLLVSIHADRFPGRRRSSSSLHMPAARFQSTPTGFPAGDGRSADRGPRPSRFNPRRPVSRPATSWRMYPRWCLTSFNPRRPVSRPATEEGRHALAGVHVSIHADRFPGRRPAGWLPGRVQRGVSIHADRFPGRRRVGSKPGPRPGSFNPRRPVSRPATRRSVVNLPVQLRFQSTPTGFPAGDLPGWRRT